MLPHLDGAQRACVLEGLEERSRTAHAGVWARRSYAPMHIHTPLFAPLKLAIERANPGYVVTFDVVFESDGRSVAWHCDYESIGPFAVRDTWTAVRDGCFRSVHFNLTADGGHLRTLSSAPLSYLYCLAIEASGVFGIAHRALNRLLQPLLECMALAHTNEVGVGNTFDNLRLHSLSSGAPRTSYVVRLAKSGQVWLSSASVRRGMQRSEDCHIFGALLDGLDASCSDVSDVQWARARPPVTVPRVCASWRTDHACAQSSSSGTSVS